ncbi:MAG: hypothetical protein KKB70_01390 [Proteobacteria bacterium]|nr:hypothetical protein [Pseudomonadota bacterium]
MEGFYDTPAGRVPQIKDSLALRDHWGSVRCRIGLRTDYTVQPGLYRMGGAGADSPVVVTANYKLTFDTVRASLRGVDCWLLIVDTDGINVWCAGGKGRFTAEGIAEIVRASGLERVVSHRELVLPQLSANGVSANALWKLCGFKGVFGPIRAEDIAPYLAHGADESMRWVTFTLAERLVLAPLEVALALKWVALVCGVGFVLSGIGPEIFSLSAAWQRGLLVVYATLTGLLVGALATPALLPWLPGRSFAFKGAVAGLVAALVVLAPLAWGRASLLEYAILVTWATVWSSYMCMNFTGSTPFTSPTGVEREMRRAIPWQLGAIMLSIAAWIAVPFF